MNTQTATATDAALLDASVRSIMLQFRFSDRSLVSNYLWTGEREKLRKEDDQRLGPGTKVILPTLHVGLKAFLFELDDSEFALTDATGEEVNASGKGEKIARFVFTRKPIPYQLNEHFVTFLKEHGRPSLERLCKDAMWQLCMFRNPRKDGTGMSINCNTRVPYVERGKKNSPNKYLRIDGNRIFIEE